MMMMMSGEANVIIQRGVFLSPFCFVDLFALPEVAD